jgi:CubicO group peptidase (beta-lactamase class C family)
MSVHGWTRRSLLASSGAVVLAGCAATGPADPELGPRDLIERLVESGAVPAAGLVVFRSGAPVFSHAAGLAQGAGSEAEPVAFTAGTKMRMASISKLATALTAHALADQGACDLDTPADEWFPGGLRHPAYPETPITLGQLLSHTAGLADPDTYWVDAPGAIEDAFGAAMWRDAAYGPPGAGFEYANLGYGIAATVLERMTGERFDRLAKSLVLDPSGITGGFNWSGVSPAARREGATLYRRVEGVWTPQTDGPEVLAGSRPFLRAPEGYDVDTYSPGTNGTLFAPQGGLRASLLEAARLARAVATHPRSSQIVWRYDPVAGNGNSDDGYFEAYGEGPQHHEPARSPLPGIALIGHHGEAFGLYAASFHAPALDAEFAFAVTGSPSPSAEGDPRHAVINVITAPLWSAAEMILRGL